MTSRIVIFLISCVLLASCSTSRPLEPVQMACDYDRTRLLALDEAKFDQDPSGGWRALASKPGCNLAAADLLRDYRRVHQLESGLLYWHEGQLRAFAEQSQEAISVMERARKPADADRAGWNLYVDATIAFLRKDRLALDNARLKLAAVQPPIGKDVPPVIDGVMEVQMNGERTKIRWPPNIDVVEGLVHCFDKPYGDAYANECRTRPD